MSLDKNLFTLHVTQNKDNPLVVDLIDPSGTVHYRKQRLPGIEYKVEVYDPLSESLLITATSPSASNKFKTLELYNPSSVVELKFTGTLSFRWSFKWEQHEFEWKREECFMVRKPDPPVLVAVTKEPPGKIKTTAVQILDYNLNRFDIDDRKGLEIVILTALLTFQDVNETYHTPAAESVQSPSPSGSGRKTSGSAMPVATTPPQPPPKPAPKKGVERIAEMQALRGEYNEIMVEDEGHVNDYATYCARLLEDDAMLFVTLRSAAADQVPKVLQVVEQAKRIRHKAGLETELHQYVLYDTAEKHKGTKRIVLDDTSTTKSKYTPPNSLVVHLSKIEMPELQPKANGHDKSWKKKAPQPPTHHPNRTTARSTSPNTHIRSEYGTSSLSPPTRPRPRNSTSTLKKPTSPATTTLQPPRNSRNRFGRSSFRNDDGMPEPDPGVRKQPDAKQDPLASPSSGLGSSIPFWNSRHGRRPSNPAQPESPSSGSGSATGVVGVLFDRLKR